MISSTKLGIILIVGAVWCYLRANNFNQNAMFIEIACMLLLIGMMLFMVITGLYELFKDGGVP